MHVQTVSTKRSRYGGRVLVVGLSKDIVTFQLACNYQIMYYSSTRCNRVVLSSIILLHVRCKYSLQQANGDYFHNVRGTRHSDQGCCTTFGAFVGCRGNPSHYVWFAGFAGKEAMMMLTETGRRANSLLVLEGSRI